MYRLWVDVLWQRQLHNDPYIITNAHTTITITTIEVPGRCVRGRARTID
jgi:hypothetical protein